MIFFIVIWIEQSKVLLEKSLQSNTSERLAMFLLVFAIYVKFSLIFFVVNYFLYLCLQTSLLYF